MSVWDIYIDGASKGNPGAAGVGIVIFKEGARLKDISRHIGNTTNNVAEYTALIYALEEALILKAGKVKVLTDSELLAKQINREYKVRHPNLKPLFEQARNLSRGFKSFEIRHIVREKNKEADRLADKAARSLK